MKANMKCSHYEYRDSDLVWTYLNSSLFNICIVQIILVKISTSDICVYFYFKLIWNYNHGSYYTIKSLVLNELQDEINERILTQCVCYIWKAKKSNFKSKRISPVRCIIEFQTVNWLHQSNKTVNFQEVLIVWSVL